MKKKGVGGRGLDLGFGTANFFEKKTYTSNLVTYCYCI